MPLYAITVFLSAFLLFAVQPMLGKAILPWFGGSPAVWTTCMLFFQALLLLGYAYASGLARLKPRRQAWLHSALLLAAVLFLPIMPSELWRPSGEQEPVLRILGVLAASVGGPYLMLASTAPLVQAWFGRVQRRRSPYRLYALSNAGSLLALMAYPAIVERWLRLPVQTGTWSVAFAVFALLCGACAWRAATAPEADAATSGARPAADARPPAARDVAVWLALSGLGSMMLLAATNQICQDVASVPFLWVLPLGLYLLTFILCFGNEDRDLGTWFAAASVLAVVVAAWALELGPALHLGEQVAVHSLALFVCCMACHGELVKRRPGLRHLTAFYLVLAAGGFLGGVFVSLVAPAVFDDFWEYPLGLVLCFALGAAVVAREVLGGDRSRRRLTVAGGVVLILTGVLVAEIDRRIASARLSALVTERDFFGVFRVTDVVNAQPPLRLRSIWSGLVRHGVQILEPAKRRWPLGYHGTRSGVGLALGNHPRERAGEPLRIGVVGLGAGTLAAYAEAGDTVRFYEISPTVARMADEHFTYLADARERGVEVTTVLGDARLQLERELERGEPGRFDVLAIDAFTGDAVPIHLLTREAAAIYWRHLAPGGVIAFNVSNIHLDLDPVIRALGREAGAHALRVTSHGNGSLGELDARWWLLSRDPEALAAEDLRRPAEPEAVDGPWVAWTDDFSSLFSVLR